MELNEKELQSKLDSLKEENSSLAGEIGCF